MKKAEELFINFAMEILFELTFGHMTTFWIITYYEIVLVVTAANIPITN